MLRIVMTLGESCLPAYRFGLRLRTIPDIYLYVCILNDSLLLDKFDSPKKCHFTKRTPTRIAIKSIQINNLQHILSGVEVCYFCRFYPGVGKTSGQIWAWPQNQNHTRAFPCNHHLPGLLLRLPAWGSHTKPYRLTHLCGWRVLPYFPCS